METIAYHYERSAWSDKAVEYLQLAGDRARRVYANEAAIGYYERAIAMLERRRIPAGSPDCGRNAPTSLPSPVSNVEAQQEFADVGRTEADPVRRIELLRKEALAWQKQGKL